VPTDVEDLAEIASPDHGKVRSDAAGEVQGGLEAVEGAGGLGHLVGGEHAEQVSRGVVVFALGEALGVVAGITPLNFVARVPMRMHPIAIACGDTFVRTPSERYPTASMRIAELYAKAGLPDGVFNVVNGDKRAVDALLDHEDVAAVSFVGSTPIARQI